MLAFDCFRMLQRYGVSAAGTKKVERGKGWLVSVASKKKKYDGRWGCDSIELLLTRMMRR